MSAVPFVSVIIPTFRDTARLIKCIRAIEKQTYAIDRFEVLVVDNDGDGDDIWLSTNLNLTILREATPGSYAARNAALFACQGSIIAFTDSDCIPHKEWISAGVRGLAEGRADRVAGRVSLFSRNSRPTPSECYELVFAFDQKANVAKGASVTANLFVSRLVFESVGLFNAQLKSGGDIEWNRRATHFGFSIVYASDCIVAHPARSSWNELARKSRRVLGGEIMRDPNYEKGLLRSIAPPVAAIRKSIWRRDVSLWIKINAWTVAYILKVYKYLYLRSLLRGNAQIER